MIKYKSVNMKFDYQKFCNDIEAFLAVHDLRHLDLDELAGIGNGNTNNVLSGRKNQKMNTWLALANAMDVDVRTYFVLDIDND